MAARNPLSSAQLEEARRLYTVEHWGTDKIGNLFQRSGQTIAYHLKAAGVKMRAQGTHVRTDSDRKRYHASVVRGGLLASAKAAAASFQHECLIRFPDHLQAQFNECLAEVRQERGTMRSQAQWGMG